MSDRLYPTLVAGGSLRTHIADNRGTLKNQITSEIDKYLQEAAERRERDDNYFDRWHVATNTSSQQQEANFVEQDDEDDEVRVPESNGHDTGKNGANHTEHDIQYQDELETIPEEDEDPQMAEKQDVDDLDTVAYTSDESEEEPFNTAIDDTSEDPTIVMGKLVTTTFVSMTYAFQLRRWVVHKLLANSKSSLIIFHPSPKKRLLNRYIKYCKC